MIGPVLFIMIKKYINILNNAIVFIAGHHYISKILDTELEIIRTKKLNEISQFLAENVRDIKTQIFDPDKPSIPENLTNEIIECANQSSESVTQILNTVRLPFEFKDYILSQMHGIEEKSKQLKSILDSVDKDSFVPWLDRLYAFLDSLTLFQESAVVHILLFIVLLLTVFNILYIFFGNEIISYFKLEQKFPSLSGIIRLRAKFQRYYLMWNIFILFLVCVFGIFANLLVLINGH